MSLNPLRALGSAPCHRIFKDFDEIEHQQSHEMRVVTWLCEITLTPAWPQYASIPHPTRPLASSPAPTPGTVVAIPEENRIQERKPARAPSSGPPHTLDRGRYRLWGRGRRGGGLLPPSPVALGLDVPVSPARGRVREATKGVKRGKNTSEWKVTASTR